MNFDLSSITTNAIVVVPIVIAIVEALKLSGWVKDHFSPLIAIGVGIIISFVGNLNSPDLTAIFLGGAIYGLMASGLYSGVKTTMVARSRMKAEEAKRNQNKHLKK